RWGACGQEKARRRPQHLIQFNSTAAAGSCRSISASPATPSASLHRNFRLAHSRVNNASGDAVSRVPRVMVDLVFFYGTLMTPFNRHGRRRIDAHLRFAGRGTIHAALFDLGIYPAAVPAQDGRVWGELYEVASEREAVLAALDEIEGHRPDIPESSLYLRKKT